MNTQNGPLLSVRDLKTYFMMDEGVVKAAEPEKPKGMLDDKWANWGKEIVKR